MYDSDDLRCLGFETFESYKIRIESWKNLVKLIKLCLGIIVSS